MGARMTQIKRGGTTEAKLIVKMVKISGNQTSLTVIESLIPGLHEGIQTE